MKIVFWIVATLAALGALFAAIGGLSALAEAERLRNPGSAALGATLLAAAGPAALLALAAAGFASLLGRLDAILAALLAQRPEPAAPPILRSTPEPATVNPADEERLAMVRHFAREADQATAWRAAEIALAARAEGRSLPTKEALRQARKALGHD